MQQQQPSSDRVRSWPFVSLSIRPEHLAEWTALARRAGRSRADLLREVLEQVGLPYARAVVRHRGVSSTASSSEDDGDSSRAGSAASALYSAETAASRRSA